MSRGRRVRAAVFTATAFVVCGFCVSAGPGRAADDDDARVILFSGRDIWRNGVFAYGGLLWSPGGLDREGFTLKTVLSGGLYRYNSGGLGGVRVVGAEMSGQLLPGWRFKRDRLEIKVFAGLDVEYHRLRPDDPGSRLRGSDTGIRTAAELWYEPTPATMLALDASLSSIATNHTARVAYGWRALDQFYLGPEMQYFASDGYRHLRVGAHLTGMKIDNYEWSAAGGWALDSARRSSPYLRLNVMTRQ